jgi:ABC-type oligopeptide transport system substrate-binding subunit
MKRSSAFLLAGVVVLGGLGLAACSSSDSASTSEASASGIVGDNPGTWAPLEIGQAVNGTTVDMVVDQAAIFTEWPEGGAVVESSVPAVVEVSQPEGTGDVTAVAGMVAKAPGTATITVLYPDQPADEGGASNIVMQFEVNVS